MVLKISTTPEQLLEEFKNKQESEIGNSFEKIFRSKPILRINENEAYIVDATFLIEFATVGPLFFLTQPGNRSVFKHYGDCFESYVQEQLKRICENKHLNVNCFMEREFKREGKLQIDAYLKIEDKIVLIEIKSSFVNNSNDLLQELEQKYCQNQGVEQLVKIIGLLEKKLSGRHKN